jgi:hypothetical protein
LHDRWKRKWINDIKNLSCDYINLQDDLFVWFAIAIVWWVSWLWKLKIEMCWCCHRCESTIDTSFRCEPPHQGGRIHKVPMENLLLSVVRKIGGIKEISCEGPHRGSESRSYSQNPGRLRSVLHRDDK